MEKKEIETTTRRDKRGVMLVACSRAWYGVMVKSGLTEQKKMDAFLVFCPTDAYIRKGFEWSPLGLSAYLCLK